MERSPILPLGQQSHHRNEVRMLNNTYFANPNPSSYRPPESTPANLPHSLTFHTCKPPTPRTPPLTPLVLHIPHKMQTPPPIPKQHTPCPSRPPTHPSRHHPIPLLTPPILFNRPRLSIPVINPVPRIRIPPTERAHILAEPTIPFHAAGGVARR